MLTKRDLTIKILICAAILIGVMIICAFVGTQKVSLIKAFHGQGDSSEHNIDYEIFFGVRIPRIILAALIGAALACSGVVLQAILRNPLADPYILGISSGAGLGVIIAVLSGINLTFWAGTSVNIFAFCGALLTVWLVWYIGHLTGKSQVVSLLLAGVVINSFFSAVIMFLTSIANSDQLYSTIFWLMGNITEKDPKLLWLSAAFILGGIMALCAVSQRLNVLTLGSKQAETLGVNTGIIRLISFALAAFITAVAVSLSGLIGFVGLIVPHSVRLVFGPDHRQLLPVSAIIGAVFLVIADTLARVVVAPAQLPVGIITAIIGGPFFLILLAKYSRKVSWLK